MLSKEIVGTDLEMVVKVVATTNGPKAETAVVVATMGPTPRQPHQQVHLQHQHPRAKPFATTTNDSETKHTNVPLTAHNTANLFPKTNSREMDRGASVSERGRPP